MWNIIFTVLFIYSTIGPIVGVLETNGPLERDYHLFIPKDLFKASVKAVFSLFKKKDKGPLNDNNIARKTSLNLAISRNKKFNCYEMINDMLVLMSYSLQEAKLIVDKDCRLEFEDILSSEAIEDMDDIQSKGYIQNACTNDYIQLVVDEILKCFHKTVQDAKFNDMLERITANRKVIKGVQMKIHHYSEQGGSRSLETLLKATNTHLNMKNSAIISHRHDPDLKRTCKGFNLPCFILESSEPVLRDFFVRDPANYSENIYLYDTTSVSLSKAIKSRIHYLIGMKEHLQVFLIRQGSVNVNFLLSQLSNIPLTVLQGMDRNMNMKEEMLFTKRIRKCYKACQYVIIPDHTLTSERQKEFIISIMNIGLKTGQMRKDRHWVIYSTEFKMPDFSDFFTATTSIEIFVKSNSQHPGKILFSSNRRDVTILTGLLDLTSLMKKCAYSTNDWIQKNSITFGMTGSINFNGPINKPPTLAYYESSLSINDPTFYWSPVSPEKMVNMIKPKKIRVAIPFIPPFFSYNNKTKSFWGFSFELFENLSNGKRDDFELVPVQPTTNETISTTICKMLANNEADMTVFPIEERPEFKDVIFKNSFMDTRSIRLVINKKASFKRMRSYYSLIFEPFTISLWIVIFLFGGVFVFSYWLLDRTKADVISMTLAKERKRFSGRLFSPKPEHNSLTYVCVQEECSKKDWHSARLKNDDFIEDRLSIIKMREKLTIGDYIYITLNQFLLSKLMTRPGYALVRETFKSQVVFALNGLFALVVVLIYAVGLYKAYTKDSFVEAMTLKDFIKFRNDFEWFYLKEGIPLDEKHVPSEIQAKNIKNSNMKSVYEKDIHHAIHRLLNNNNQILIAEDFEAQFITAMFCQMVSVVVLNPIQLLYFAMRKDVQSVYLDREVLLGGNKLEGYLESYFNSYECQNEKDEDHREEFILTPDRYVMIIISIVIIYFLFYSTVLFEKYQLLRNLKGNKENILEFGKEYQAIVTKMNDEGLEVVIPEKSGKYLLYKDSIQMNEFAKILIPQQIGIKKLSKVTVKYFGQDPFNKDNHYLTLISI